MRDVEHTCIICGKRPLFQVNGHIPSTIGVQPSPDGGCSLRTKAGPLLLDGLLEVGFACVLELRKRVGDGSVRHPRLSMRRTDVARGEAVLLPLGRNAAGQLQEDRSRAPYLCGAIGVAGL